MGGDDDVHHCSKPPTSATRSGEGAECEYVLSVLSQRAQKIRAMPVVHNRVGIARAASWIYAVLEALGSKLRDYHVPGEASAMTGAKLAALRRSVQAYASSIQERIGEC